MVLGLALAVLSSREPPLLLLAAAAAAIAGAWIAAGRPTTTSSPLAAAALGYAAVVLGSVWLWGAHYTPVAVYSMALLVGAFLVGRGWARAARGERALWSLVGVAMVAAAWGLWQAWWLGIPRAQAGFETPNLLAAFLNLALVPAIVMAALGGARPRAHQLGAVAMLAAGMFATQSRGGWIGLAAGLGIASLLAVRLCRHATPRTLVAVALSVAVGYLASAAIPALQVHESGATRTVAEAERARAGARLDSAEARLQLYAVALRGVRERPLLGSGFLSFEYLFNRDRAQVPSYAAGTSTLFVHDDYLQVLLELGVIGLIPFLLLTGAAPLLALVRARMPAPPGATFDLYGVAATAGLASMAVHALVDFPFYVPGTLAGYGLLLGVADAWLSPRGRTAARSDGVARALRLGRMALVALLAYALAMPAAAAACSKLAGARVREGRIADAVYWLGVARNLDPRDWRRAWQLAELLAQQAALLRDPRLAQIASDTFDAGIAANPLEVRDWLGWLAVQRRFGTSLPRPASRAERLARLKQVEALKPFGVEARLESALTLQSLGDSEAARTQARALLRDENADPVIVRILRDAGLG